MIKIRTREAKSTPVACEAYPCLPAEFLPAIVTFGFTRGDEYCQVFTLCHRDIAL